ncbi:hypothetical protein QZH41_017629, partial [Actinostola sp. cb2023]
HPSELKTAQYHLLHGNRLWTPVVTSTKPSKIVHIYRCYRSFSSIAREVLA